MAVEVSYVIITPYTLLKSRTGGIVARLMSRTDLEFIGAQVLAFTPEFAEAYASNLEEMKKILSKTGDSLTSTEWVYVKKILVHNAENYFNYKMFLTYINTTMTRQGALKILNNLNSYGILEKTTNKKGDTIFKFNQEFITYKYQK